MICKFVSENQIGVAVGVGVPGTAVGVGRASVGCRGAGVGVTMTASTDAAGWNCAIQRSIAPVCDRRDDDGYGYKGDFHVLHCSQSTPRLAVSSRDSFRRHIPPASPRSTQSTLVIFVTW